MLLSHLWAINLFAVEADYKSERIKNRKPIKHISAIFVSLVILPYQIIEELQFLKG